LNIINKHFGWHSNFVGTAQRDKKTGALKYLSGLWKLLSNTLLSPENPQNSWVGRIYYSDGSMCELSVPGEVGTTFEVIYQELKGVKGFNIPSHRPIYKYQHVGQINTNISTKAAA